MIKNYFKLAWRNISKHPFYSIVNIAGLFAGITFVLLIGAYVWGELGVNKNLQHARQQYFLQSRWKGEQVSYNITTLAPVAHRLREDYPNLVANYYRWDGITSGVSKGDKTFREGIQLGDSTLLSMYGFKLLHGNAATALKEPFSAVITKETAIKYFGKTAVVGETISIQNFLGGKKDFTVTGVLKPVLKNSVTNLNDNNNNTVFIPANAYTYFGRTSMEDWNNVWIPAYIELKEGASLASVQKAIDHLIQTNAPANIKANLQQILAIPLSKYYIEKDNGLVKRMLYTLSLVAIFILLMAVVNFINISISSAGSRMKEVGVRKVLGSLKKQLVIQFLAESLILVLLATVLAVLAYPFAKPFFEGIVGRQIPSLQSFPLYFILLPVLLVLAVGLLAGAYPAFVLSSINTVNSLKGKLKTVKENIVLRKSLVGFQFSIAMIVLIAATIVTQQVAYFFSRSLGYNKEYIVTSQVPRNWSPAGVKKMEIVRNEFKNIPQVNDVSLSYEIPNGNNGGSRPVYKVGSDSSKAVDIQLLITDENYLSTYQVPLRSGSFFNNSASDSGKVVMNEKAISVLGYKNAADAIGQQVNMPGDATTFTIKGVTADFHFGSMQGAIDPMMFFNVNFAPTYRFFSFKLKPGDIAGAITAIQKKWATLLPGSSFEYSFMDDTLAKLYATELQLKKAAYASAFLVLVIVLLGVLGLVSLSIQKRVKEIGIRKVLGASLANITRLFIKEFIVVILLAGAIAFPVAWYIMNKWLNNYDYRIGISVQPFIAAIVTLGFITLLLIGLQVAKAVRNNPVKNLRTE